MILIFEALLAGYIFWRAILPLRLHWGWKAALSALLAVAAFNDVCTGGNPRPTSVGDIEKLYRTAF